MSQDAKKGRPVDGPASSDNPTHTLRELADIARRLVADLEGQQRRESAALAEGYRMGFQAGREVGYQQAETDMEDAWKPVAKSVRRLGRTMTRDELDRRRWGGRREGFGEPRPGDYPGGTPEQKMRTVTGHDWVADALRDLAARDGQIRDR